MKGPWRIDAGVPQRTAYWIYEGDAPMLQCYNEEIAKRIVDTMNYSYKKYLDEIARILHPNANERFAYVPDQLAGMVRCLVDSIDAGDRHIRQLKKERDNLIEAIEALPLPNKPKPYPTKGVDGEGDQCTCDSTLEDTHVTDCPAISPR